MGHFHIVPEVKRSEVEGDLSDLLRDPAEEVIDPDKVMDETEDDTPF